MAVKGALHQNETPKNYRYLASATSSHATDVGAGLAVTGYLRIQWGTSSSIQIKLYDTDNGSGTQTTQATLTTPWGTFTSTLGGTWNSAHDSAIQIDGFYISVGSNCAYTMGFTELRWYVEGVLEETISAQTVTGTGYDRRLNYVEGEALVNEGFASVICDPELSPTYPACAASLAAETTYSSTSSISLTYGWQWFNTGTGLWVSDDVSILTVTTPTSTCTCVGTLPVLSEANSYDLVVNASYENSRTKTDLGTATCTCPTSGFQTWGYWKTNRVNFYKNSKMAAMPETSDILSHTKYALVDCFDDTDSSTSTTTELVTKAKTTQSSFNFTMERFCALEIASSPCPFPEECTGLPTYTNTYCCTYTITTVTWPTLPPCLTSGSISYDVSFAMRHHRSFTADDTIWTGYAPNSLSTWTDTDTRILADRAALRIDRSGRTQPILLLIETAGSIKLYLSTDGVSFTLADTIATGTRPALVCCKDGRRHLFWLDGTAIKSQIRDAAGTIIKAAFTPSGIAAVDDTDFDVDESFRANGSRIITIICSVAGSVTTYTSTDGVSFS